MNTAQLFICKLQVFMFIFTVTVPTVYIVEIWYAIY
jgi:hypothetical protein